MIIKYAKLPKSTNKHFSDLELGDLFVVGEFYHDKCVYMKIVQRDIMYQSGLCVNCISFLDNQLYRMLAYTNVTKINGSFIVEN